MNSYLYLKFENYDKNNLVIKLRNINVSIYSLKEEQNYIIIKILASDYEKIEKYLKTAKFKKIKYSGPIYYKKTLHKYHLVLIGVLLAIVLVFCSSFFIVDITVVHDNDEIVSLVLDELERYGVKKFSLAKSFSEIEEIKNKIKDSHLDKIDWLEINKVGMKYIVRVEERIINSEKHDKNYCHIYADKDGVISNIKLVQGEMQVDLGDYVKKGDILISGDIHLNENVVNSVCANGNVYAEVWYTVNVKVPLYYYLEEKTGKVRNNLIINYDGIDHQLFKDRLTEYKSEKKELFDLLGIKVYLKKDEEITKKKKKYTIKEAEKKAMKEAVQKIELTLNDDERIVSQKVLQKTVNDSTIDIDIFIVAQENIAIQKEAFPNGDGLS